MRAPGRTRNPNLLICPSHQWAPRKCVGELTDTIRKELLNRLLVAKQNLSPNTSRFKNTPVLSKLSPPLNSSTTAGKGERVDDLCFEKTNRGGWGDVSATGPEYWMLRSPPLRERSEATLYKHSGLGMSCHTTDEIRSASAGNSSGILRVSVVAVRSHVVQALLVGDVVPFLTGWQRTIDDVRCQPVLFRLGHCLVV